MNQPSFLATLPTARDALAFARSRHAGQARGSDRAPFILHPLEVASLLFNTGHSEALVAAGILHDAIEKSPAGREELAARFGPEIAQIVAALSENPAIASRPQRKAALRSQVASFGNGAIAVYAADKVAKVRELRAEAARDRSLLSDASSPARVPLDHYRASLSLLEEHASEDPLVRQLRFELEALEMFPPQPREVAPTEPAAPQTRIDWTSAKVCDGVLVVRLRGPKSKAWARRFERVVAILDRGAARWGEISLRKKRIVVTGLEEGSESDLGHLLESVVLQVNSALHAGQEEIGDLSEDPGAERDRRMSEVFRGFAAREPVAR